MKLLVNHNRQVVDVATQPIRLLAYTSCGTPIAAEQLGFTYDQGWNMTGRAVNGTPTSYTVNDLNEVTAIGGTPCTYDQNGNRTTYGQDSGTTQCTYDDENRLIRASYSTAYRKGKGGTHCNIGHTKRRKQVGVETKYFHNLFSRSSSQACPLSAAPFRVRLPNELRAKIKKVSVNDNVIFTTMK